MYDDDDGLIRPENTSAASLVKDFYPSATGKRFMLSTQFINVMCGPRGEGKTTHGLMAVMQHAQLVGTQYWPLHWALIRDTRRNIGTTTAQTVDDWFPRPYAVWRGKKEEPESITLFMQNSPAVIFDCFGVAIPKDLNKFQSYEAAGVWIEEPAPAATNVEVSSGISEAVLAMAVTSVRGSPFPRIQLTMNPPPADHWTAQLWRFPGFDEAGDRELEMSADQRRARQQLRQDSAVFFIPPGENIALDKKTPGYRERNRMALMAMGRPDLVARLVEGRVGYAKIGEAVTPEFSGAHITEGLAPLPNRPFFCGYDFGLMPACIICQISPLGHLNILASFALENEGMRQLIDKLVMPWFQNHHLTQAHKMHIGGWEATQRDQSDSEMEALKVILNTLGGRYVPGPVSWSARRDACREALLKDVSGSKWVRCDRQGAASLIRALDGGWFYPEDSAGKVRNELPDKKGTPPSLGDAFAHTVAVLLKKATPRDVDPFQRKEKRTEPRPFSGITSYRSRTGA